MLPGLRDLSLMEGSDFVGRSLDWGLKGRYFETQYQQSHCVVSLSKTLYSLLGTVSTQEERKSSQHD